MSVIDKIKLDGTTYDVGKTPDTTLAVSGSPADAAKVGTELDKKVDKVTGKGLSTEDFTTAEKMKLTGIAEGATNIVIDPTLTQEGQAAGAKETGNKITSLKEDLTPLYTKIINGSDLVNNGYVDTDTGAVSAYQYLYKRSSYVDVSRYSCIRVTLPTFASDNNIGIVFYTAEKTFMSGTGVKGRNTGTASYEERFVQVPDGATYAMVSFRASEVSAFYMYGDVVKSINKNQDLFNDGNKIYADYVQCSNWENGSFNQQGVELAYSGYFRTTAIYVANSVLDITVNEGFFIWIYEFSESGTFIKRTSYDADVTHTLDSITSIVKLTCRANPHDQTSTIGIVNNFTVSGYLYTKNYFDFKIDSLEKSPTNICIGMQLFEKIGVIGDSISVGWAKDKNGNNSRRNTRISWVQQMARRLGCVAYNLGASGVDAVTWFTTEYCYSQYQSTNECDLYIIGLGLNGGTLGTVSDINESDYTQNASTFYGQYARIIQMINHDHPNAIVMCLTEPTTRISSYDQAVRDICALNYINAELVDLESDYFDLFNTAEILAEHQPDGLHFTPYGYSLLASAMITALNDYISKYSSAFKYVGVTEVS